MSYTSRNIGQLAARTGTAGAPSYWQSTTLANTLATGTYNGISGLALPTVTANYGHLWMINDNVSNSVIIAVNAATGATAGEWTLSLTAPTVRVDWEDLATCRVGTNNYVYVPDMGNNPNTASKHTTSGYTPQNVDIRVYRFPEPTITGGNGTITNGTIECIACNFPGADLSLTGFHRDCEAFLVDPDNGDMYFITKRNFPARIYKLAHQSSYSGAQTLTYVGSLAADPLSVNPTFGTGSKSLTTTNGLAYELHSRVRVQENATLAGAATNYMEGFVTARSGTSLTIFVEGAGTETGNAGTATSAATVCLPMSTTPTANNGCVTGGSIHPNGTEITLVSYGNMYVFPRAKGETIAAALARAPYVASAPPGSAWAKHDATAVPAMPQREAVEYADPAGTTLISCTEWNSGKGSVNYIQKHVRTAKPVQKVFLQYGLNGYTGTQDTYIDSTANTSDFSAAASLISDINPALTATAYSALTSAAGGTETEFTVASATNFAVGRKALVVVSTGSTTYNGCHEVTNVTGLQIRLKIAYAGSTVGTGNVYPHSQEREGLVKFTDLSSIPAGSTIVDAVLRLWIGTEGDSYALHRMLTSWTHTDTYSSLGGLFVDDVKVKKTPDHLTPSGMATYTGYQFLPVPPATVQGWLDGTMNNYGWAVLEAQTGDLTGNGFQWDSAEGVTQTRRPMLIVSYIAP